MDGGGGQGYRWPADMERRRIAALEKFQRKNPDYVLPGTDRNRSVGEKCGPSPMKALSLKRTTRGRPTNNENRWCLATTLELLAEMKALVLAKKLSCLGEDMEKWKVIAIRLSNPRGLELRKLARSSQVRFDNLRRNFRSTLRSRIEAEVQDRMIEFFQICEQHKTLSYSSP